MSELEREIEQFFAEGRSEVKRLFEQAGQEFVDTNIAEGDYQNRTGHLRASNFFDASEDELVCGNHASYASEVEAKGYNVIDSGVKKLIERFG
jgi:hypothetical protein